MEKAVSQSEKETLESSLEVSRKTPDPLNEFRAQAEMAYAAYLKAQRKVATAYKERDLQEERAYKEIEQQANQACDEAIEQAWQGSRESSEQIWKVFQGDGAT